MPTFDMTVMPANFTSAEKNNMLLNLKEIEDSNVVAIDLELHQRLVLASRTSLSTRMIHNKETTESIDLLDALSLALQLIEIGNREIQAEYPRACNRYLDNCLFPYLRSPKMQRGFIFM